jgi:chromosome segregation ATPase
MMEMSQRLEKENADLKCRNSDLKCRLSSIETGFAQLSSSSERIVQQLENENADLKCRNADLEGRVSSLERENASVSSSSLSGQRRQELEQTNLDLMTRTGTEQDAYDPHHAEIIKTTQHLEEEDNDLSSRLSSLEAGSASISSPDQRVGELERTNALLTRLSDALHVDPRTSISISIKRAQALQAQVGTEHATDMQMREISNKLQKRMQDMQEAQKEEAQQAREVQKLLPQKNQELENQVRPDLLLKDRSFAMQDNARRAMLDKEPLIRGVAGHAMPARQIETTPCVNPANTSNDIYSSLVSPRLPRHQLNVCHDRGMLQSLVSDDSWSLKVRVIDASSATQTS